MRLLDRFRSRPGLSNAIGVALALVAGVTLLGYITRAAGSDEGGKMRVVQFARADIPVGSSITEAVLEKKEVPARYVVPGSFEESSGIVGARAARGIFKGEPVIESAVAGGKGSANLASRIPPGMRAYTICLREGSSGSADLRPGDRVDVLSTTGDAPSTSTILSGKPVLSVGADASRDEGGFSAGQPASLTLVVSPAEAELLAQAASTGEISVSLCPAAPADAKQRQ